jgi:DNA transformation protein
VPKLTDLPNIAEDLADQLKKAGITTPAKLRKAGSVGAAARLRQTGLRVCSAELYALEGAIRGIGWHSIPPVERSALWVQFMSPESRHE